jgi:flagellar motor switch protein FliG
LRAASPADVTGDQAATLLSDLQDRLRADGETRFASIEYATDEELAMHGGS